MTSFLLLGFFVLLSLLGFFALQLPQRAGYASEILRSLLPTAGLLIAGACGIMAFREVIQVRGTFLTLILALVLFLASVVVLSFGVYFTTQKAKELFTNY